MLRRGPMRIIELPLNARLDDVIGGINERVALEQQRILLEEGALARAHRNLLYIDEINLLEPQVADAILDAAAQGRTFVRRGPMTRLYPSQFVLVGSMNPEEGSLRPRDPRPAGAAGLGRAAGRPRAAAGGLSPRARIPRGPRGLPRALRRGDLAAQAGGRGRARDPAACHDRARGRGVRAQVHPGAGHPSHRAEITLLEAARARVAADYRTQATLDDVRKIAPLALRMRRSSRLVAYAEEVAVEDRAIEAVLEQAEAPEPRNRRTPEPGPKQRTKNKEQKRPETQEPKTENREPT